VVVADDLRRKATAAIERSRAVEMTSTYAAVHSRFAKRTVPLCANIPLQTVASTDGTARHAVILDEYIRFDLIRSPSRLRMAGVCALRRPPKKIRSRCHSRTLSQGGVNGQEAVS
jgi:hypothetical protein